MSLCRAVAVQRKGLRPCYRELVRNVSTVVRPPMWSQSRPARAPAPSELSDALKACRAAFLGVALMSGMLNILYLTGSFFMLEVYDRVIPSRSIPTLLGLAAIAALLYAFQGIMDLLRGRILVRIGSALDEALASRVYGLVARLPLTSRSAGDGLQPLRDLDQVRSFMSGLGPPALFDLPWMPLYLGICFLFHPYIGLATTVGGLGALSKVLRMVLQSAVLGLGAYLVIKQEATAGIIIAGSILTSRALAPMELAIANWKGFVAARQSWRRLNELLSALAPEAAPMELPRPAQSLAVEGVSVLPPGGRTAVVQDVSFR